MPSRSRRATWCASRSRNSVRSRCAALDASEALTMPLVRIESSIPLPPQTSRAAAFDAILECITRGRGVKPVQVRVAFDQLDAANVMVAGKTGADAPPWLVAWTYILEG